MKATKKDNVMVCCVCNKPLSVDDTYEKITTSRGSDIVVHTDCIYRKGE